MSDEYNKVLENFLASESPEEFKSTLYNLIDDYQNRLGDEVWPPFNIDIHDMSISGAKGRNQKFKDRLSAPEVSADELDAVASDFFNTDWTWGGMDLRTRYDVRPKKVGSQYRKFRERVAPRKMFGGEIKRFFNWTPPFHLLIQEPDVIEQDDTTIEMPTTEMPEDYRKGGRVRLI